MASIRKKNKSKFTSLSNGLLQDSELSFACRGMLGYVLSKPEGWETKPSDIEREGGIGKDARRAIMKEAEKAGYLTFHTARGGLGRIEAWYDAHEEPVLPEERTQSWETGKRKLIPVKTAASPGAENPQADGTGSQTTPGTENPHLDNGGNPPSPGAGQPGAGEPPAGQPGAGQPGAGQPGPLINTEYEKKEIEKKEIENTENERDRAVEMFETAFDLKVTIFQQEQLAMVTDLEVWKETIHEWKTNAYSVRNLAGMLRLYRENVVRPGRQGSGAYVGQSGFRSVAEILPALVGRVQSPVMVCLDLPPLPPEPDYFARFREAIQEQLNAISYATWFKPLGFVSLNAGVLTVRVPDLVFEDYLLNNYRDLIEGALVAAGIEVERMEFQAGMVPGIEVKEAA